MFQWNCKCTRTGNSRWNIVQQQATINASTGDVTLGTSTPGNLHRYTIAASGGPVVTAATTITITPSFSNYFFMQGHLIVPMQELQQLRERAQLVELIVQQPA
ncbi:MAG: hypothetical protein IPI88_08430 [Chitinophagaceae bacterium]|nr:hypothetical protein [Chitinophagaceae bacterium]